MFLFDFQWDHEKLLSKNNFYFLFPCQKIPLHTELHPHAPVCLLHLESSCSFHQRCGFVCRWNHGPLPHVNGTELPLPPTLHWTFNSFPEGNKEIFSPIAETEIVKQTILCKPKDQVLRLNSALILRSVDSNEALTISTSQEFNLWEKKPTIFPFQKSKIKSKYKTANLQKFYCFFILIEFCPHFYRNQP